MSYFILKWSSICSIFCTCNTMTSLNIKLNIASQQLNFQLGFLYHKLLIRTKALSRQSEFENLPTEKIHKNPQYD